MASPYNSPQLTIIARLSGRLRHATKTRRNRRPDVGRTPHDDNARRFEGRDLLGGSARTARDDGPGVTHSPAWRRRLTRDETNDRFRELVLDEGRGFFLRRTSDFAEFNSIQYLFS